MSCKCAPALLALRDQLNRSFPNRDKASDGCCGDPAHASRKSDHNPDAAGYAHAYDVDEDVEAGHGLKPLVSWIPELLADPRAKYVIYEKRIYYADCSSHGTRCFAAGGHDYTGANAHDKHLHFSIKSGATFNTAPWPMPFAQPQPIPGPTPEPIPEPENQEDDDMTNTRLIQSGNRLDLFLIGTDKGIYHRWSNDGGATWNPAGEDSYESLGGVAKQIVGAKRLPGGEYVVQVVGSDDGIWQIRWAGGWSGWLKLGGKVNPGG